MPKNYDKLKHIFTLLAAGAIVIGTAIIALWIGAIITGSAAMGGVGGVLLLPFLAVAFAAAIVSDVIWDWTDL